MIGRHGCIPDLSCELGGMLGSINIQFGGRNAMDTESSATLDKVEESFTIPELPDRNCEKEED